MEETHRLEKEYTISYDLFRDAYKAFQKKHVYPRSYVFMVLFLLIAVIYIAAAWKDPSNKIAYLLIFISMAFAFREWYNPRKLRRSIVDAVREMGEIRYRIEIGDEWIGFSTIETENVENSVESEENKSDTEEDEAPEKTRIPIDSSLSVEEYDRFFLMFSGKSMFYIIPKESFSDDELEIIRNLEQCGK